MHAFATPIPTISGSIWFTWDPPDCIRRVATVLRFLSNHDEGAPRSPKARDRGHRQLDKTLYETKATRLLLPSHWNCEILLLVAKMKNAKQKADVPHGTLSLMVLKTLDVIGPLNGYAIARRIEQISGDLLAVNQGTLYPVLLKLEQEGAIASEWGASENNRRARFYRVSRSGRKLLQTETRDWEQTTAILGRFFELKAEDLT
jgi:PadR family transcriptional regulator PadR